MPTVRNTCQPIRDVHVHHISLHLHFFDFAPRPQPAAQPFRSRGHRGAVARHLGHERLAVRRFHLRSASTGHRCEKHRVPKLFSARLESESGSRLGRGCGRFRSKTSRPRGRRGGTGEEDHDGSTWSSRVCVETISPCYHGQF